MKKLESYEEYRAARKAVKGDRIYNNITFMPKELQRYIDLGRVMYESTDKGLFLYFDEENYYRFCMYADADHDYNISSKDKLLYVRNFYRDNDTSGLETRINNILTACGWEFKDNVWETRAKVDEVLEEKAPILEEHIKRIQQSGLKIVKGDADLFPAIDKMMEEASFLEPYHFPYRTQEERNAIAEYGGYICIINDKGKLCGTAITEIHDGVGDGTAIAVDPKYRLSGLASVLCYLRLKMLKEHDIKLATGSVSDRNTASKKFFLSMGYEIVDRKIDEWVLSDVKNSL